MDLDALVAEASAILDAAVPRFLNGHRADSAIRKKGNDFATEVDLAIERQVVTALEKATGIGVHGEEFGATAVDVTVSELAIESFFPADAQTGAYVASRWRSSRSSRSAQ